MTKKQVAIESLCEELETLFKSFNETFCRDCTSCCCDKCSEYGAFLNPDRLKKLCQEYPFDSKTGFLTKTGCILPRQKRSNTCLHYICDEIRASLKQKVEVNVPVTFTLGGREYTSVYSYMFFAGSFLTSVVSDLVDKVCKLRGWSK